MSVEQSELSKPSNKYLRDPRFPVYAVTLILGTAAIIIIGKTFNLSLILTPTGARSEMMGRLPVMLYRVYNRVTQERVTIRPLVQCKINLIICTG